MRPTGASLQPAGVGLAPRGPAPPLAVQPGMVGPPLPPVVLGGSLDQACPEGAAVPGMPGCTYGKWRITNARLMQMEYDFQGDFKVKGESVKLAVDHPTATGDTGWRVWDGGILLAKALETKLKTWTSKEHPVVLELGCGSGIASIAAAFLGAEVYATDRDCIRDRTLKNIALNQGTIQKRGGSCEFKVVDWNNIARDAGNVPRSPDLIIASDVVWDDSFMVPLANALDALHKDPKVPVVLCQKERCKEMDDKLLQVLGQAGFKLVDRFGSKEATPETEFHHDAVWFCVLQR
mmetsp:Transcript_33345/g.70533  ORF Transcript_33345/g.70533 Transcript_33345/m.70533 type:complete len:292 (+) Transcript_33345:1-876(+)